MARPFRLPREALVQAMQSKPVRRSLRDRARPVADRYNQFAQADGSDLRARIEEGTRPKGRPYARVVVDGGAGEEYGDSKTTRRRRLGRATDAK